MVAKLSRVIRHYDVSLNLAKIHMVAKRMASHYFGDGSLNLAKIHMVTKPINK